ncbi:hypothetical protein Cni_G05461 [Canna indica]|uniref:V-type proton ATPase subunit S1/VOA1 transmembrane domain-containing protein n=1 Tax=Canna indica TaxID=4628 RepID=A0AAQ3JUT2_9LILI|nr:hypothetical protein Cni_G05461 [Canna indica]
MGAVEVLLLVMVFAVAQMPQVLGTPVTAPAFLWSPQNFGSSEHDNKEFVDYQTISPKDLARLVLLEGGWSNIVCSQGNGNENMDVAVVFVGRKLQSSDISSSKQQDPLIDLLKLSFTTSNMSMAFPYVAIHEEETLENSLIKGFAENCAQGFGVNRIAYLDTCSISGGNFKKLEVVHSVQEFLVSRMSGKTDLIVLCSENSEESDNTKAEGKVLSDVVNSLKQSGAKYTVLYASKPQRTIQYPSHLAMRFLAESNESSASNSTCDGVCQIKSSLLEGIFVAIVLLIILISGLCCMAGIDTPTRFEAPQES